MKHLYSNRYTSEKLHEKLQVSCPSPHCSRRLLLHRRYARYDKPGGERARRSVGQYTVSSMPPSFTAPRVRLVRRLGGFVTSARE